LAQAIWLKNMAQTMPLIRTLYLTHPCKGPTVGPPLPQTLFGTFTVLVRHQAIVAT